MFSQKRVSPFLKVISIIILIILGLVLFNRLDFWGWLLRGIAAAFPANPRVQYSPEEIQALVDKVRSLEQQNAILQDTIIQSRQQDALESLRQSIPFETLPAKVIYRDHSKMFWTAIIDKGTHDGIKVNMPVMDSRGLVGRVVAARSAVSRIILLTSPECSFGVIDQRSGDIGIVRGSDTVAWRDGNPGQSSSNIPPNILEFIYLSPAAHINVQDVLVTNGLSGITPKNLRVGEVIEIINREDEGNFLIRVRPFADFEHLENVVVILYQNENIDEIKDLLNDTGFENNPL